MFGLLAALLLLCGCHRTPEPSPAPTLSPTAEVTPPPISTPAPTPEETKELWGFPIDDTHDAFEVPTGGRLGTVLVTVEGRPANTDFGEYTDFWDHEMTISVWEAENLSEPIQTMVKPMEGIVFGAHDVVDANFDGYLDFGCQYFQGNQPTYWYYWIWDEEQGLFVEEPAFSVDEAGGAVGGISMPTFAPETQTVYGYARGGFAGAAGTHTLHQWIDGKLVCIRRIVTFPYGGDTLNEIRLTVEEPVDGALTEIFRHETDIGTAFEEVDKWCDLNYHGEEG